jgi:soluble lytic murein transglycosylase
MRESRAVANAVLTISAALWMTACARHDSPAPASVASAGSASGAGAAEAAAAAASVPAAWQDAVRLERWDQAWRELGALDAAEQSKPEVRYAKARVAMARGEAAEAIAPLEGLEGELPLLADDVKRWRAEAELLVGPYEAAGDWFGSRGTPAMQVKAAQAFEKGKLPVRARAACDRLVTMEHRTRAQEAEGRAIRVRLASASDATGDAIAADDARWLATRGADLGVAKDAEAALAKLDPKHPLTTDELLLRASTLADASKADDALHALEQLGGAPGRRVPTLERLRAKGDALFKARGRYSEAARVLHECAAAGGPHVAEDAFHSARALARADRDEEAITALAHVAHQHAKTTWGDEAAFLLGRLQLLHGRWRDAARALDDYATRYPNGAEKRDAARDRAIAHLMNDAHAAARKLFEQLAEDEADPLAAARARTMAALAALRDGDRTHAIARWTDVARSRPLSWPALVARARLAETGAPLPPMIDPGEPGAPLEPLAVALPPPVDILHRIGLDADAENTLRDRESTITSAVPARSVEALCAAYGQLGRAKRRYQIAQQIPAALLAAAPSARTQWSWDCAYPRPYDGQIREREATEALPENIVYAVMRQESGFDPDVVSGARAVGLLQLLPETAKEVALEAHLSREPHDDARLTSPPYNIAIGARYLHDLLAKYHGVAPLAIAAYNGGPDSVSRWLARPKGLDLDVFVERIPFAETRAYVARVMGNLARYGFLQKGEAGVPLVSLHALD